MDIPDKIITELELRRNTGERGTRKYVAYEGIVYDVTDCPRWQKELHARMHFPGQDLSGEINKDAPHKDEVFSRPCVKVVGRLQKLSL